MNSLFDLSGKVAIVTGSGGQLGPVWCETLEALGAKVFRADLPECDVTSKSQVKHAVWECCQLYGPPDILINSAAIDNPPGSGATFFGNLERIVSVNLIGACNMAQAVIPGMIENGGGTIVNIGSIQGNIGADWRNYPEGFEKPVGYNLSKAALIQLSRSITVQYGRYGIRSATIAFGPFDGGKLSQEFLDKFLKNVPLGRPISRQSVAATLAYAVCCPELAGQQVLVDGGLTVW